MLLGNFTSDFWEGGSTLITQSWNPDEISDNHCPQVPAAAFQVIDSNSAHTTVNGGTPCKALDILE